MLWVLFAAGGCEPFQIRRSDGLIMAQPPLPAVWQCAVPNTTFEIALAIRRIAKRRGYTNQ